MRKIKLLSLSAGPAGVRQPGTVLEVPADVSADEADALVAGHYAEPFAGGPVGAAPSAPKAAADGVLTETATAGPQARPKPVPKSKRGK